MSTQFDTKYVYSHMRLIKILCRFSRAVESRHSSKSLGLERNNKSFDKLAMPIVLLEKPTNVIKIVIRKM